jgi:adenylosuccinate synthase
MLSEISYLKDKGVDTSNLRVSERAHVIMPYHVAIDTYEEAAKGDQKIGTTKNGIGPCYMDKYARVGIRIADLMDKEVFAERLASVLKSKNDIIVKLYGGEPFDYDEMFKQYCDYADQIRPYVADTSVLVSEALQRNENVVFEGAQGTLLDIDHGTYPYVTSSNPIASYACVGAGVGPTNIKNVLGIIKAYTTRVGEGPFPTELFDETGDTLQRIGHEFGTVTGRTRRCGWMDIVMVNYAIRLSGINEFALMKLDVLDTLETVKICTHYECNGEKVIHFPTSLKKLAECKPVYEELPGWQCDTTGCASFDELPENAKRYVERIEALTGVPVKIVAVGPRRDQTIIRGGLFE